VARFQRQAQSEMGAVWADAHAKWRDIATRQTQAMRDALFVSGFDGSKASITPYQVTTAVRKGGGISNALSIKPR
jgi:hypothetical protein